ncbi:glycosyltransferase family 2 protein [Ekhidna sp. To15]|uniref:glycosyltransferase family 2 protein n=1 Tax=Ekhidna sp. To15 TaxID=3395267 RepID=UPI003F5287E5
MAKTAVVILNYNGVSYLEKFLPSVVTYSPNATIVVADNSSTDNSIPFLEKNFPKVELIKLDKNYGYAGGYNEALKQIEAEYFLLLNSDVEVTTNWLNPLEQFLDAHPNYAACQPKIKDYNHKSLFEYAGACGGFIDFLGYPFCRGRIFDQVESDSGQYNEEVDIFWSSGACMMVRSEVFFNAGGFDSDFFAHMEEIDLCWRIHSLGHQIKCIPKSTVFHVGGGTLAKSSPFKTYLNFRNGLYILIKNLPLNKLIFKLPIRMTLDWVAAIKFLFEGNPNHSVAVIKAHFSVLWNFSKMTRKRKLTSITPKTKLMIYEYYLRGSRKYSDLYN